MKEGRQGKSTFDAKYYKFKYSDLQRAYGNNMKSYYMHYMKYGKMKTEKAVLMIFMMEWTIPEYIILIIITTIM